MKIRTNVTSGLLNDNVIGVSGISAVVTDSLNFCKSVWVF